MRVHATAVLGRRVQGESQLTQTWSKLRKQERRRQRSVPVAHTHRTPARCTKSVIKPSSLGGEVLFPVEEAAGGSAAEGDAAANSSPTCSRGASSAADWSSRRRSEPCGKRSCRGSAPAVLLLLMAPPKGVVVSALRSAATARPLQPVAEAPLPGTSAAVAAETVRAARRRTQEEKEGRRAPAIRQHLRSIIVTSFLRRRALRLISSRAVADRSRRGYHRQLSPACPTGLFCEMIGDGPHYLLRLCCPGSDALLTCRRSPLTCRHGARPGSITAHA